MKTVAVIFGGRSQEYESSVASGIKVIEALQKSRKYRVIPVGVTREGKWYIGKNLLEIMQALKGNTQNQKALEKDLMPVQISHDLSRELIIFEKQKNNTEKIHRKKIDVAFAWIPGPNGEDGTLQGFFEVADIPYVGCGVFASAVGFDKTLTKEILNAAEIPQVDYGALDRKEWENITKESLKKIIKKIGFPCFIKPACCGSSIGISKVKQEKDLKKAMEEAFKYDDKVLIEKSIEKVHEIECAVLGDEDGLKISTPGEVHYEGEFYDYNAKYLSKYWEIDIPPKIPKKIVEKIQSLAEKAFRAVHGSGAARIDFLVEESQHGDRKTWKIYLNEMNTIPNFRPVSCYPHLLKQSGISYAQIIDRLIQLALKRHKEKQKKDFSFVSGTDWFKKQ